MIHTLLYLLLALLLTISPSAYVIRGSFRKELSLNVKPGSYAAMLEAAKLAKSQPPQKPAPLTAAATSAPKKSPLQPRQPPANGLPFDDELYGHLKYVIEKLSARMKSEKALSSVELQKFQMSVDAIIADSKPSNVPSTTKGTGASYTPFDNADRHLESLMDESDSDRQLELLMDESDGIAGYGDISHTDDSPTVDGDAFGRFRGIKSTWNIPGMDQMTTEEYYKAINERNNKIKAARKNSTTYEREPVKGYFESLSRKTREGEHKKSYWVPAVSKAPENNL